MASRLDGIVGVTDPITARFAASRARLAVVRNVPALPLPGAAATAPADLPSPRTIVLAGVLDESRAMLQVAEALGLLVRRWPDLHLLCFGELAHTAFGQALRRRAAEAGAAHHVILRERIPWRDLQAYLAASLVGLVLYGEGRNNRWGLPNRLFEFMAHGVPVVATDFPLLREVVSDAQCGLRVDSTRPAAIADAIARLVEDPALRARLGATGRRAVRERYNWDIEIEPLIELYRAVIGHPGA